jgi:hypothetical protein
MYTVWAFLILSKLKLTFPLFMGKLNKKHNILFILPS